MMMVISPISDKNQWKVWEVDHIDQNKNNNSFSNLCWVLARTNRDKYNNSVANMTAKAKRRGA